MMSDITTSRRCWSWRSCFATVKYNKSKTKKQQTRQLHLGKSSTLDQTRNKRLQKVDENSNLLCESDFPAEYDYYLTSNSSVVKNDLSINTDIENATNRDWMQEADDESNSKLVYPKASSSARTSQLDAIVEDINEDDFEESNEGKKPVRLYCDREIVDDANEFYSRLIDLSKMNHVIIQFNDNGHLLSEFTRQIGKLQSKTDHIQRGSSESPCHAELLEARYSSLLATIESLSLLLKIAQISSLRSLINRLIFSIEQRMAQLNKHVQIESSSSLLNLRQQGQGLKDDDFLSFRSALSSYEHLLAIPL